MYGSTGSTRLRIRTISGRPHLPTNRRNANETRQLTRRGRTTDRRPHAVERRHGQHYGFANYKFTTHHQNHYHWLQNYVNNAGFRLGTIFGYPNSQPLKYFPFRRSRPVASQYFPRNFVRKFSHRNVDRPTTVRGFALSP